MNEMKLSPLVQKLSNGRHLVQFTSRSEDSHDDLQKCIDRGYVHIMFPETRGGTELGVTIERTLCNLSETNVRERRGLLHLEGKLTLDYQPVRCIADLDLESLSGEGYLVVAEKQPSATP